MQNPTPREGLLFPKEKLTFQDFKTIDFKDKIGSLSYVDIADTGDDNHCVIIGILHMKRIFITDVLFTKLGTDQNVNLTAEILNRNVPEFVLIESNFGGGMYGQLLAPKLNKIISVNPIKAKSNKHARITQLAGFMKMYCVFRSDYEKGSDYDKFMRNLMEYNKNGTVKHDDAPDCLEGLCKTALDLHINYFDEIPSSDSAS
jgi:predicted phage terminase large subunit-like protein